MPSGFTAIASWFIAIAIRCNAECESDIPGRCSADLSEFLQTKVKVSNLEAEHIDRKGKDKDAIIAERQKSRLVADRAYFHSLMDLSVTTYMAGVPIYNSHQMPGGLNPSELQLSQTFESIASFTTKTCMDTFCIHLSAAHNLCSCDAEENATLLAIVKCTVSDMQAFLSSEDAKGYCMPKFIEPDTKVQALPVFDHSRSESPSLLQDATEGTTDVWGLDRIDGTSTTDNHYSTYPGSSQGSHVHVYIADTGIKYDHTDFEGRAETTLECLSGNGQCTECSPQNKTCGYDRHGHGTHCAGTVGGKKYGVAKKTNLYSLKVLSDEGYGRTSGPIASIEWVILNGKKPAVWSASLGGPGNIASYEQAFQTAIKNDVVIVVAAGNSNSDACGFSPAFAPSAITVGSTTKSDARSDFSNYGACLDIWAPGSSIKSAGAASITAEDTMSGTSMACPHVSGAMALFLSDMTEAEIDPDPTAAEMILKGIAIGGEISDIKPHSPDKMLYIGDKNPTLETYTTTTAGTSTTTTTVNTCKDETGPNGQKWHDAYGSDFDCEWYASDASHCEVYGAYDPNFGMVAQQACCACGKDDPTTTTTTISSTTTTTLPTTTISTTSHVVVVGEPYVCAKTDGDFHDSLCYCNGDVYLGKKYVSGNSGVTTTFDQMTDGDAGSCKAYHEDKFQKTGCKMRTYEQLKTSKYTRPGWKWTKCGGCIWFFSKYLYQGQAKHCYCMPKYPPPTPQTSTTAAPFTFPPTEPPSPPGWEPEGPPGWR